MIVKKESVFPLHIRAIKTSQPANQKANFFFLAVPAHGKHYGLWHWVPLRITENLSTLIDFSALARDLNVVVLKISATNGNMYVVFWGEEEFGCIYCCGLDSQWLGHIHWLRIRLRDCGRRLERGEGGASPNFHLRYNWEKARKSQSWLPKNARDISLRRVGRFLKPILERLADFRYFAIKTPNVFRQP
jgi:hypothetical protein